MKIFWATTIVFFLTGCGDCMDSSSSGGWAVDDEPESETDDVEDESRVHISTGNEGRNSANDDSGSDVEMFCERTLGCADGETCLSGECEVSCFDVANCEEGQTCRWEDDAVVCLDPWTCTLGDAQAVFSSAVGHCSVTYNCSGAERVYEFRCSATGPECYCIEDGKITGTVERPPEVDEYTMCSTTRPSLSTVNTVCGWAILPNP